ncbi:MAG: PrsW family intramembrane metalloprotease [Treponema sp.]|nr:PrsW family intramembrane metalloprotease [Treponema sp.]
MNIYASIAMTFIPLVTVYICFLLLGKDFNKVHGAAACLCGLLALLPIELLLIIIHTWHPFASVNLPGRLIKGLLINGIIEESAKMAFLFLLPAKKSKLSAFFSYAVLCGLTLGCLETLIYLIYGNRSITLRLFTAVVMHTFCAGLSGLFVYCIKRRQELADKSLLWLPFALAVLFHGLYNYFAGIYGTLHYFAYAVIAATILECKLRYQSVKIKFERKASVNPGLENQGDAKKMGLGFLKKIFGSSEEAAEKTQVQESAQTVAEDDATIADDATMVDSDSTLVSEDNSSDETISSDVQADMSFAMHTAAELASDKPRSDDKFAEALKLVDVFDEDKDPQPDPISETEAFESIEKAEKAVTKSTRGRKKGSTVKKTAEKAVKEAKKTAKTAEKKASAAKKAVTKKATAAKKTAEKAVKEAKTTAKKTAKTAEKKVSAAKKAVTKKATAAKKTAEKAVKKTAAKASTAKKTAASKAAGAKASATKKVKAAKATVAKKSATLKATKASAAKKTATAKATTAKKTAAKKTTK